MDIDVLIIIVAVAISIFTSISKKKREAAKRRNTPNQPSRGEQPEGNDPWAAFKEIIREFSEEGKSEEDASGHSEKAHDETEDIFGRKIFSYEDEAVERMNRNAEEVAVNDVTSVRSSDLYTEYSRQNPTASARNKQAKPVSAIVPGLDENHRTEDISEGNKQRANDVLRQFNLRDAIIYSEILKPKFKE